MLEMKDCLEDLYHAVGGNHPLLCDGDVKGVRWFLTVIAGEKRSQAQRASGLTTILRERELLVAVSFSPLGNAARLSGITSSRSDFRWS